MEEKIYQKNQAVLREKYPSLYHALETKVYEEEPIAIGVTTVENRKVPYAIHEEKQYQLDSLYDSEPLLTIWYDSLKPISYLTTFIWFGLGNGMYLRKLLETAQEEFPVLVYEPSLSVIAAVMEEFDIATLLENPRVQLVVPGYAGDFEKAAFQLLNFENKGALQYGAYLNYNAIFPQQAEEFISNLQLIINSINSTQSVLERFGEAYFHNTLNNLPYLIRGRTLEQLYYALPKDVPAIIVAAGPSLDKNILQLKEAKNRAFVIAVDTAVRALLKNDITPDLFVTVDGKKIATHFTDERIRSIPVVCCLQGNRDALGTHTGPKFFFDDENEYIREFFRRKGKEFAGLSTGGSVANDAFSLADTLRFQTIILVGQDLAYTNYMSHASATAPGEAGGKIGNRELVQVEGYYGGTVTSSTEFQLYRKWFEDIIVEKPYLKVINATEGGANIKGAKNIPLKDALSQECHREVDFAQLIQEIPSFFSEQEQTEFVAYLADSVMKLKSIMEDVQAGIHNYDEIRTLVLQSKMDDGQMKHFMRKNRELTEKLDGEPVMCFVQYRIQQMSRTLYGQDIAQPHHGNCEVLNTIQTGRDYLESVYRAIEETIPILHKRLVEESPEDTMKRNKIVAEVNGLLGEMHLEVQKAMRCFDE